MGSMSNAPAAPGYDMNYPSTSAGAGYPSTEIAAPAAAAAASRTTVSAATSIATAAAGSGSAASTTCSWIAPIPPIHASPSGSTPPSRRTRTILSRRRRSCEPHDADDGFRSGGEIRFGSTFGIGSACDTCNTGCGGYGGCNSGCGCNACANQEYAWEAAWWALDKDVTHCVLRRSNSR